LSRPHVAPAVPRVITAAEKQMREPSTFVRATDYMAYGRTGDRGAYQNNASPRRGRMGTFCMAECFEHKGRFLDALLDETWLIAEETSWEMSAHIRHEGVLPDIEDLRVDLAVAMIGCHFAEILYLLGEEMDAVTPLWRRRINHEVRRRCVEPFLNAHHWWPEGEMNWNSVCHGGVAGAVLLSDLDVQTKARVLHRTLDKVRNFLKGFTADGGCTEGPGYWKFGVSWFCILAYYVDQATDGRIDLLADPIVKPVLQYPANVILTGGEVANFADCAASVPFTNGPVAWAAARLGVEEMIALASLAGPGEGVGGNVLDLVLAAAPRPFDPPRDAWLPDLQVLNVRGAGKEGEQLVLAAKAGNNGEVHNHNDVGQFIVHWRGESLICDLGAPLYTKQTFSPRRYELLATRALGHDVPLINGVEQPAGKEYAASDVACSIGEDEVRLSMNIAAAYPPEAKVKSLVRTLVLHRDGEEWVELADEVQFEGVGGSYELPLYTPGKFERAGEGEVRVIGKKGALTIEFDPGVVEAKLEGVEHGDARLEKQFGAAAPRCMLVLKGPCAPAALCVKFLPCHGL